MKVSGGLHLLSLLGVLSTLGCLRAAPQSASEAMFVSTGTVTTPPLSCMDTQWNRNAAGTVIQQWGCNGSAAQRWVRVFNHTDDQGTDWYKVKKANTNLCWGMAASGTTPGTALLLWDCAESADQVFSFIEKPGKRYEIHPLHVPTMCLDVVLGSSSAGTQLQLWGCNSSPAQAFGLIMLGPVGSLSGWGIGMPTTQPDEVTAPDSVWKVQAGREDVAVVLANGTLLAWGSYFAEKVPADSKDAVMDIATGSWHTAVLLYNGSIVVFGWCDDGQCTQPPSLQGSVVKQVAAGHKHTLALLASGKVVAFGYNNINQTLVPTEALSGVTSIAAGAFTSLAVKSDASVVQWGSTSRLPDVVVQEGVLAVTAGWDQCLAILPDHTVVTWQAGAPSYPATIDKVLAVPTAATTGHVKAIAAKDNTSMALLESGELLVWGAPDPAALAIPEGATSNVIAMTTSGNYTLVLKASGPPTVPTPPAPPAPPFPSLPAGSGGHLVSWGSGAPYDFTQEVKAGNRVWKVSAGLKHVVVLLTNGEVRAFGDDSSGQATVPDKAKTGVIDISAGSWHNLAIKTDGSVVGWGYNPDGQSTVPATLQGVRVKQVAAGYKHSLALTEDGKVVGWGDSTKFDQASVPAELTGSNVTAIAAGAWTSVAVLDGGKSVVQWGSHSNLPPEVVDKGIMPGPHSIAVGLDHVTGLLADGSVSVWPAATNGPAFRDSLTEVMKVPQRARSNVTAVSASNNISMALLSSGEVIIWGKPADPGVLGVPDEAKSGIMAIAAGGNFGIALTAPPSPPRPPPSPSPPAPPPDAAPAPPPGPRTSTTIAFTMNLVVNSAVALNTTTQRAFGGQLQQAIATFLKVLMDQVQLTVQLPPPGRRRLQQADTTTTLQVTAQVAASWATSDTATRDALRQQVTQLDQTPASIFPAAMVQQFGLQQVTLQGPVLVTPGTLFDAAPPPSPGPSPSSSSGGSSVGIIAGAAAGAAVVVIALAGALFWWLRRGKAGGASEQARGVSVAKSPPDIWPDAEKAWALQDRGVHAPPAVSPFVAQYDMGGSGAGTTQSQQGMRQSDYDTAVTPASTDLAGKLQPAGVMAGDPFLHTAKQLTWTDYTPGPHTVRVEAGINDVQLDAHAVNGSCPVIEMSSPDFKKHMEILTCGLIGKGGAALVFMCRWPSRFGPDALLAAKVLKNAYDASPSILQSFAYEAKLLASIGHANVVRLYGYCLELPTVCLIMELLPGSLEDLLYRSGTLNRFSQWSTALSQVLGPGTAGSHGQAATNTSNTACNTPGAGYTASTQHTAEGVLSATASGEVQRDTSTQLNQRMSMLQVLRVCVDVAAGLNYLHNRQLSAAVAGLVTSCSTTGYITEVPDTTESLQAQTSETLNAKVVHRDLKPANILLNSRGQAKLSDFGLARENATTTVHTVHVGAGTLHYMAPELLATRGTGMLPTNRVDIYSLGIMMWEMVAGKKPWSGLNPMQLQMAVNAKKRPTIPEHDSDGASSHAELGSMPASFYAVPGFVDLVRACWRQRDHKRPPASEVHDKLRAMLQQFIEQHR